MRADWLAGPVAGHYPPGVLLAMAQHLREVIHALMGAHRANRATNASTLNVFPRQAPSHPMLVWENDTSHVKRLHPANPVRQCLASLAKATARLFAEGGLQLVCVYGHPEYTLWFYDHTKPHKCRQCSMAVRGNRRKVVEYYKRQQDWLWP